MAIGIPFLKKCEAMQNFSLASVFDVLPIVSLHFENNMLLVGASNLQSLMPMLYAIVIINAHIISNKKYYDHLICI